MNRFEKNLILRITKHNDSAAFWFENSESEFFTTVLDDSFLHKIRPKLLIFNANESLATGQGYPDD